MARVVAVVAVLAGGLSAAAPSGAAPGNIDGGFGSGGVTLIAAGDGNQSPASSVAIGSDGHILAAGEVVQGGLPLVALHRLTPDGAPAGAAFTPIGGEASGHAVALAPDGQLAVAGLGTTGGGVSTFGFARYNAAGALDSAGFGLAGVQTVQVGTESAARAVAVQSDRKVVAAGRSVTGGVESVALVRLKTDGTPDTSAFGPAGFQTFDAGSAPPSAATAVAIQPDERIVVAGFGRGSGDAGIQVAVARRLTDGGPDPSFGGPAGVARMTVGDGGESAAYALALHPGGAIVVGGTARVGTRERGMLARFTGTGSPDAGFGAGGSYVLPEVGDEVIVSAVGVQPDGRIVFAGHTTDSSGSQLLVGRVNADGTPDATFGTNGLAITPLGDSGLAEATALAIQGDRVVIAGWVDDGGAIKAVVARYVLADPVAPGGAGGGGSGPPPPAGGLTPDVLRPSLALRLTNTTFRAGRGTSPFAAGRRAAPVGTTIRYTLSEAARVTIQVQRKARGVRVGNRCLKPSKRRKGRRCTRWVKQGKTLTRESVQGATSIRWNGRIGRKALPVASYRLLVNARDAARNASPARTRSFKVVKR